MTNYQNLVYILRAMRLHRWQLVIKSNGFSVAFSLESFIDKTEFTCFGKDTFKNSMAHKLSKTLIEYGIVLILVASAFVLSTIHFLNQNVQSLVPFSSISTCDSASEVYNLVSQRTDVTYPMTLTLSNVNTGKIINGYTEASFVSRWSSCLMQSADALQLNPESSVLYGPIEVPGNIDFLTFNGSTSTNNDCFRLFCGIELVFHHDVNIHRNYNEFLNNSIFANLFFNPNDALEVVNGTTMLVNNQIVTSIVGTNDSVVATCSLSLAGSYLELFSVSNSVVSTGTYLCTQSTTSFQAVSSALSITLSTIGLCRLYFWGKAYLDEL